MLYSFLLWFLQFLKLFAAFHIILITTTEAFYPPTWLYTRSSHNNHNTYNHNHTAHIHNQPRWQQQRA